MSERDPDFPLGPEDTKDTRVLLTNNLTVAFKGTTHADWAPLVNDAMDRAEDGDLDGVRDLQKLCLAATAMLQSILDNSARAEAAGKAAIDA